MIKAGFRARNFVPYSISYRTTDTEYRKKRLATIATNNFI